MTPLQLLASALPALRALPAQFALAGGVAASFYRDRPRLTNDIDIALVAGTDEETRNIAERFLREQGYLPALGWIAESRGLLSSPVAMIIGRLTDEPADPTLDMLLPVFPWLRAAVQRAQHNEMDLGFGAVPTILPEDVIVAKAFALTVEPNRFQDLDDIQSILRAKPDLDLLLLVSELERLGLRLPRELKPVLPPALLRLVKRAGS